MSRVSVAGELRILTLVTKPGYEYNFTQLPIMLILGSARWHELLPETITPQSAGALEKSEQKLEELLQWAHAEAQAFAEKSKTVHLYN